MSVNILQRVCQVKPKTDFYSHTYISLKNAYVYFAVGKAANSTVKHHLYELEHQGTHFKTKSVHDRQNSPLLSPYQLPQAMMEEVFTSDKYFRFVVVRNPYTRLLSCYLDRIVPANSLPYRQLIVATKRAVGDAFTFEEFVQAVCAQRPFQQNNHWRVQAHEVCRSVIPMDFVGKQENFAADMARIWSRIAAGQNVPDFSAENKAPSITSAESRLAEFYTPNLIDAVRSAYAEDFDAFGYSTKIELAGLGSS
jgi:hypothetical protein